MSLMPKVFVVFRRAEEGLIVMNGSYTPLRKIRFHYGNNCLTATIVITAIVIIKLHFYLIYNPIVSMLD